MHEIQLTEKWDVSVLCSSEYFSIEFHGLLSTLHLPKIILFSG